MENKKENFREELDMYLSELNHKILDLDFKYGIIQSENKELREIVDNLVSVISTLAPADVKAAALESINRVQKFKNYDSEYEHGKDLPGNAII